MLQLFNPLNMDDIELLGTLAGGGILCCDLCSSSSKNLPSEHLKVLVVVVRLDAPRLLALWRTCDQSHF